MKRVIRHALFKLMFPSARAHQKTATKSINRQKLELHWVLILPLIRIFSCIVLSKNKISGLKGVEWFISCGAAYIEKTFCIICVNFRDEAANAKSKERTHKKTNWQPVGMGGHIITRVHDVFQRWRSLSAKWQKRFSPRLKSAFFWTQVGNMWGLQKYLLLYNVWENS